MRNMRSNTRRARAKAEAVAASTDRSHAMICLLGLATAAALLMLLAGSAHAYPTYDDGSNPVAPYGVGCVECHAGFKGGPTNNLHFAHTSQNSITTCGLCHTSNTGGTTPVYTYKSVAGYGCTGCHGRDYGEMNEDETPAPKSTGYGLRRAHANVGVTVCAGCHALNNADVLGENVKPPYYTTHSTNLRNPCDRLQEDFIGPSFSNNDTGLDNDGDGLFDYPDDPDCMEPTTTTSISTTTTTLPPATCGPAPLSTCVAGGKASLQVSEKAPGKQKLKASISKLLPAVAQSLFGDPVDGSTSYALCIYNASNALVGEYSVARAGQNCSGKACWEDVKGTTYKYNDKALAADGIQKIQLKGGDAGKGKLSVRGNNKESTLPTGVAAALNGATSATVQLLSSNARCFSKAVTTVKTADGTEFSATAP